MVIEKLSPLETKIVITVKSIEGACDAHEVGDTIEIYPYRDRKPFFICPEAYTAIFHYIFALKHGAEIPWVKEGEALAACPDPENQVVFEIRRKKI